MMKKGFTLAEVLITLATIGVVATMVLPGVLISVNEQQSKTAIKKAVNVLTTIAKMNEAIDGYDFAGTNVASTADDDQSVFSMITRRGDIDWTQMSDKLTSYKPASATALPGAETGNYVIFFKDGSYVSFPSDTLGKNTAVLETDNLPKGFPVLYDMNGAKSPNFLSNCQGNAALTASATVKDDVALANCGDKTKRIIKDQFGLRIRGNTVQPNGAASKWLYQN